MEISGKLSRRREVYELRQKTENKYLCRIFVRQGCHLMYANLNYYSVHRSLCKVH